MSALPAEPLVHPAPESFDMRDYFDGIVGFLAGPANVVLQLGRPAVGHGVVEKPHPDGDVMRHRLGAGRFMTWTNTGFLPPVFREQLGLTWTATDERAFTTVMRGVGFGCRLMPRMARNFPFNYLLWDVRRRVRAGKPIV